MKQITILPILRVVGGERAEQLALAEEKPQQNTGVTYLQVLKCYKHA